MSISIEGVARNTELRKALAALDFVVLEPHEKDDDWYHVSASERFEAVSGEGSGGRFLLGQSSGLMLYISTEGRAGVIAASLAERYRALEVSAIRLFICAWGNVILSKRSCLWLQNISPGRTCWRAKRFLPARIQNTSNF